MNNIYKLLILIQVLIFGCGNNVYDKTKFVQSIDNLEMKIYSDNGVKLYSINSPNTTYNKDTNSFKLAKTTIKLFKNGEIEYTINADKSELSNNNKFLEMNGNVKVKTMRLNNDVLYASKFIWNIEDLTYTLLGDVKFENDTIILSSNKAILGTNKIIEFFHPVYYLLKDNDTLNYEINSENALYNIETQSVSFSSTKKRVRSKLYF